MTGDEADADRAYRYSLAIALLGLVVLVVGVVLPSLPFLVGGGAFLVGGVLQVFALYSGAGRSVLSTIAVLREAVPGVAWFWLGVRNDEGFILFAGTVLSIHALLLALSTRYEINRSAVLALLAAVSAAYFFWVGTLLVAVVLLGFAGLFVRQARQRASLTTA